MKIALLDTETTGLLKPSPAKLETQPKIIELYMVKIDDQLDMLDEYESFFDPGEELDPVITKITRITDDMLKNQPAFASRYQQIAKWMTGVDVLVGHNLSFDRDMLYNDLSRIGREKQFPWPRHHICTIEQSMPIKGRRLKLEELHEIATGKKHENAHRAKDDVFALVRVFIWLIQEGFIDLDDYR